MPYVIQPDDVRFLVLPGDVVRTPAVLFCRARLLGCLAGPALERVVKGAGFLIAKKPSHFGSWQVVFMQIASGEVKSQAIENFAKRVSFRREPAPQRSLAYAEPLSNLAISARPCGSSGAMAFSTFNRQAPDPTR
jgi:hypothetical protein